MLSSSSICGGPRPPNAGTHFTKMGWVNLESERMTDILFLPWVGFKPTTSWLTVQRVATELSLLSNDVTWRFWTDHIKECQLLVKYSYSRVMRERAAMQDIDEMSSVKLSNEMAKSVIECIHSPNAGTHWRRWSTRPLQNISWLTSAPCVLKVKQLWW